MEIDPTPNPSLEKKEARVRVILKSLDILELDFSECEILGELKLVLLENPLLKLHPNFTFTHKKKTLKEFEALSSQINPELGLIPVELQFGPFNQRTAFQHVFNCCLFFEDPKNFLFSSFLEFNIILGWTDYIHNTLLKQKELPQFDFQIQDIMEGDLSLLQQFSLFQEQKEDEKTLFFKEFSYSKFNPPLGQGKVQGDLLYLDLLTQENQHYCITLNKSGVFLNETKASQFSCRPSGQVFQSIFDLLSSLSPFFKSCLTQFIDLHNPSTYKAFSESFQLTKPLDCGFSKWLQPIVHYDSRTT